MTAFPKVNTLTVDEFLQRYPNDEPFELLEGEILSVPPPQFTHGSVAGRLLRYLAAFVYDHHLGEATTDVGFRLSESTLIAPDVSFIRTERYAQANNATEYFPFAPDLAVEIVFPSNSANEIALKAELYLTAGSELVWIIYPKLHKVVVYHADHSTYDVSLGGTLTGEALLPGFNIPVADLFPPSATAGGES